MKAASIFLDLLQAAEEKCAIETVSRFVFGLWKQKHGFNFKWSTECSFLSAAQPTDQGEESIVLLFVVMGFLGTVFWSPKYTQKGKRFFFSESLKYTFLGCIQRKLFSKMGAFTKEAFFKKNGCIHRFFFSKNGYIKTKLYFKMEASSSFFYRSLEKEFVLSMCLWLGCYQT